MKDALDIIEEDPEENVPDPDEAPIENRKVATQPYDLVVKSLNDQIKSKTIILQPSFQRGYIWPVKTASRLIESIILNVPIPPCYFSQNAEFEMDVIDGQQRLTSVHRFTKNEYALSSLEVCKELNGKRFYELPIRIQRQIENHTIRCVVVTNDSDEEIKFDVFERLNTNTIPLNAQELRNCLYRSEFNSLLKELASEKTWLGVLGRKTPDKRMRGEELILRFFSFQTLGLQSYKTPLKNWLNDTAAAARNFDTAKVHEMKALWHDTLNTCLVWFSPDECFRKRNTRAINRGLFDLVTFTASRVGVDRAMEKRAEFRTRYFNLLEENVEYNDVVSRSVDHTKRTKRRFEIWNSKMAGIGD